MHQILMRHAIVKRNSRSVCLLALLHGPIGTCLVNVIMYGMVCKFVISSDKSMVIYMISHHDFK